MSNLLPCHPTLGCTEAWLHSSPSMQPYGQVRQSHHSGFVMSCCRCSAVYRSAEDIARPFPEDQQRSLNECVANAPSWSKPSSFASRATLAESSVVGRRGTSYWRRRLVAMQLLCCRPGPLASTNKLGAMGWSHRDGMPEQCNDCAHHGTDRDSSSGPGSVADILAWFDAVERWHR